MEQQLLFTPGPVNLAKNVREAIGQSDICHREVDFNGLLHRIENKLLKLFQVKTALAYRAVVITGSGTAANEAIISSVVGDKNILILSNGEFGGRLHSISQIHNKNTFLLEFDWGQAFDLEIIERYFNHHSIDVVAMVHHETSSGMLNSIEAIGKLSKAHGAIFVVDGVAVWVQKQLIWKNATSRFVQVQAQKRLALLLDYLLSLAKPVNLKN